MGNPFGPSAQSAQNPQQAVGNQSAALQSQLPAISSVQAGQVQPTGQTLQQSQNVLAPQQQALQNSIYGSYAPQLYQIGNYLNQLNSQGGVQTASSNLAGQGGTLVNQALAANQQANPAYYSALGTTGNQLSNLLNSFNVTGGLSGSQQAQAARSFAQQDAQKGILNSPSQTAALSNAMGFGSALTAQQQALGSAIGQANTFLGQSNPSSSGLNGFNIGSGLSTTQSNPGANQFITSIPNSGTVANTNVQNTSSGLLNNAGQASTTQNTVDAQGATGQSSLNAVQGSLAAFGQTSSNPMGLSSV